jgi:hypothetical protein
MSDIQQTQIKTKVGFLQDGDGNNSSGRLIKVASFIVACIIAGFMLFVKDAQNNYTILAIGSFLSIAIGTEITQKVTGK